MLRLEVRSLEPGVWEIRSGFQRSLLVASFMATPTVMFRKSIVETIGSFSQALRGSEDFEYWWRAATHGVRMAYVEQTLIERHKDGQSITSQHLRFGFQMLKALEMCENTSRRAGQVELLAALRAAKQRTWCDMIKQYALLGQRRQALHATGGRFTTVHRGARGSTSSRRWSDRERSRSASGCGKKAESGLL